MSEQELLAHIVRLEQRHLCVGTVEVLGMPTVDMDSLVQLHLGWSSKQERRVLADLAEVRDLHRLGMLRLHSLLTRPALLNFLQQAAEDIEDDDRMSGLVGDLALVARLQRLRYSHERLVLGEVEFEEVQP